MTHPMRLASLGGATTTTYVDDVFVSYLRSGTSASTAVTTGIDMTKGGLVITKARSAATSWKFTDTARGVQLALSSDGTAAQVTDTNGLTAFGATGYTIGSDANYNNSTGSVTYVDYSFRKAPKFFDVVTWTGDNTTRNISHSLGITPGMIVVKRTDTASTQGWVVWHTSTGGTNNLLLNTTAAAAALVNGRISAATSTTFTVQAGSTDNADVNATGGTYVAYLFAHDTAADGLIQCGSFTTDGSGNATVNLGWEPQFLITKTSSVTGNWHIQDTFRGLVASSDNSARLIANLSNAEDSTTAIKINSTGFTNSSASNNIIIYIAIRRPNKPPTSGTQVFQPTVYTGTNVNNRLVDTTIAPDMVWVRQRNDTVLTGMVVGDRLRGQWYLLTGGTDAEVTSATALDQQIVSTTEYGTPFSAMNGFYVGTDATAKLNVSTTASNHIAEAFKRAPGFFDQVCYEGTGVNRTIPHNLSAVPELIIVKRREVAGAWEIYCASLLNTEFLVLNTNAGKATGTTRWNSTTPTATVFSLGTNSTVNQSTGLYTAYLFASLPGIQYISSYVGDGTTGRVINCGFTNGARFVCIKATSTTGDWLVSDTARGIIAANDPRLSLNSTAAEVTTEDWLDPSPSGFIVNQTASSNANVNGVTYLVWAIA